METYSGKKINSADLNIKIQDLARTLNSDIILFSGCLDATTWPYFETTDAACDTLTVLIFRGEGGYFYNDNEFKLYTIGEFLKSKYTNINTIVLDYAKSAFSVLALSSNKLNFIEKTSGIGTYDPQLLFQTTSCFETFDLNAVDFSRGRVIRCSIIPKNSIIENIIFTLNYTYSSIKKGQILSSDIDSFDDQFDIMLGIKPKSGISYEINHRIVIPLAKLLEIGLNIELVSENIKDELNCLNETIMEKTKGYNPFDYIFEFAPINQINKKY